ncbi:unnamed protein product [Pleuronectes platessa]|uniref:Uncharacterized protein n=1 Tax=Pleuronectes platessa TaxID=8262 RepID=A0A9N7YPL5_PLEPL|nr:unnamed protein product [Pleuronectes platessa]
MTQSSKPSVRSVRQQSAPHSRQRLFVSWRLLGNVPRLHRKYQLPLAPLCDHTSSHQIKPTVTNEGNFSPERRAPSIQSRTSRRQTSRRVMLQLLRDEQERGRTAVNQHAALLLVYPTTQTTSPLHTRETLSWETHTNTTCDRVKRDTGSTFLGRTHTHVSDFVPCLRPGSETLSLRSCEDTSPPSSRVDTSPPSSRVDTSPPSSRVDTSPPSSRVDTSPPS